jgi:hypothetical protein
MLKAPFARAFRAPWFEAGWANGYNCKQFFYRGRLLRMRRLVSRFQQDDRSEASESLVLRDSRCRGLFSMRVFVRVVESAIITLRLAPSREARRIA